MNTHRIIESNGMGKAGKFAKTGTIQVVEVTGPGTYEIKKAIRYQRYDMPSKLEALRKAKLFMDTLNPLNTL